MSQTLVIFAALAMTLACFSCMRSFMAASRAEDYGRAIWYKGAASLCFVFLGLVCTFQSLMRAAGDIPVTIAMGVSEVITRISLAFLFSHLFGYSGLCWVSAITWMASAALGAWRFLSGRWIHRAVSARSAA